MSRTIEPHIHALDKLVGHAQIVVFNKHHLALDIRSPGEGFPSPDDVFPREIVGVGLACKHNLNRAIAAGKQFEQALLILEQEIWSLVFRKPAGKAQREGFMVQQKATRGFMVVSGVLFAMLACKPSPEVGNQPCALQAPHFP